MTFPARAHAKLSFARNLNISSSRKLLLPATAAPHLVCLLAVLLVTVAGCGSETGDRVSVTGKVTEAGQPLKGATDGLTRIEFLLLGEEEDDAASAMLDTRTADIRPDGSYEIELLPGEYAVVVHQLTDYRSGENALANVFPQADSPLKVQIEASRELNVEIDDYRKQN